MRLPLAKGITLGITTLALLLAPAISSAADSAPKKVSASKKEAGAKTESVKDKIKKKLETRPGQATGAVRG